VSAGESEEVFIVRMQAWPPVTACVKCGGGIGSTAYGLPDGRFFAPENLAVTGADVPGWWCRECCVAGTDDEEE
jgi:hypothetical protein